MTLLIQILFFSCLWIFGFHVVVKKFILLHIFDYDLDEKWEGTWIKWGDYPPGSANDINCRTYVSGLKKWQKFWMRPLFACPPCMSSAHGSIIYFWFLFGHYSWFGWVPFCVCLCGLNYIISQLIHGND